MWVSSRFHCVNTVKSHTTEAEHACNTCYRALLFLNYIPKCLWYPVENTILFHLKTSGTAIEGKVQNLIFIIFDNGVVFVLFFLFSVICPFPNKEHHANHSADEYMTYGNNTEDVFDQWWHKTKTVPLYLIILLLPLLNFKSASFFARFTFLGKFNCLLFSPLCV